MTQNYDDLRKRMVREQLVPRHIEDKRVLQAMWKVPRHEFVPEELRQHAYEDNPLAIGLEQTISQPFIVALMTQLLQLQGDEIVLEIGTGSGYQTALLAELSQFVYSIERHEPLARKAGHRLKQLGYQNVTVLVGDGTLGYPEKAPYDAILVAATGPVIPGPLRTQMADGGRMILPVGQDQSQFLLRVKRKNDAWYVENMLRVRFVPLLGKHGFH